MSRAVMRLNHTAFVFTARQAKQQQSHNSIERKMAIVIHINTRFISKGLPLKEAALCIV